MSRDQGFPQLENGRSRIWIQRVSAPEHKCLDMVLGYLRVCCPSAWAQSAQVRVVGLVVELRAVLHPGKGGLCKLTAEASPGGMGSA